jgi:hypothetical protein
MDPTYCPRWEPNLSIYLLKPEYNIFKNAGSSLGHSHSVGTRDKMREIAKCRSPTNSIKIQVLDLGASPTNTKTIYNSISAAAKALNILQQTISVYFKRNQTKPYKGRYVFIKI